MLNHSALPRESDTPYLLWHDESMLVVSAWEIGQGKHLGVPVLCGIPYRRGLVRIDVGYNIDPNAAANSR